MRSMQKYTIKSLYKFKPFLQIPIEYVNLTFSIKTIWYTFFFLKKYIFNFFFEGALKLI